jgi:hypothetical protein
MGAELSGQILNLPEKLAYGNLDRFGNTEQGLDGNDFLPALYLAQVFGIEVRLLSQFLLREPGPLAITPDRFSQKLAMPKDRFSFPFAVRHNPKD